MPYTLDPNNKSPSSDKKKVSAGQLRAMNFDYDYPNGLDLRPGYELHDSLVDMVMERARDSHRHMSQRHNDWRRIDKNLKAYIYEPRRMEHNQSDDEKGNDYTGRVIMPISYAQLETILTFMLTAFMDNPVFKYEGTGPEDVVGAELMTLIVDKHIRRNAIGLNFHTAWRDMFAYGIGAATPVWDRTYGKKTVVQQMGFIDQMRGIFSTVGEERSESEYQVIREGNKLENIDPYRLLLDPNTSAHEVQDGEFVGWIDRTNLMSLLRDEGGPGSELFNVKYLKEINSESSFLKSVGRREQDDTSNTSNVTNPVDLVWMYVDLIPSMWDLGDSDMPEKWTFAVAGDKVIVNARPVGLTHGDFPVAIGAPDYDGYSILPGSKMSSIEEMQRIIDFLYTSHLENIKRVINDSLVVDPSLINIHDVNDNKPGKVIRMRRKAWGKGGIDAAIKQLDVRDVTQQNVEEALLLQDFAQQMTGATDNVLGNLPQRSSRISASEIQGVRQSSLSRLERPARILSMQFMMPIARMFAEHTQQLMDQEEFVRLTGDTRERLRDEFGMEPDRNRVPVNPLDLVVDYDLIPHDATFPGKESGQLWIELYKILGQNPELSQAMDTVRIFKHIARQLGAKNVDDFVRNNPTPQVVPDDQVQEAVRRGDAIPAQGQ